MKEIPETSVVITCFNYGQYLDDCITSVLNQTYRDFEIIVVDDGSTDNTPEIMKRYVGLANVRYIRQENTGQANAKNRGIWESKGKYIAFLDADDKWDPRKLEKQVPLFFNDLVGVVFSGFTYMNAQGENLDETRNGEWLLPRRGRVTDFLLVDNFVPFSTSVVRRESLDKCGVFDESLKMGIDWDLWLRLSTEFEFDYVDEPLVVYRKGHSNQMSRNLEERQRCADRILEKFLNQFPETVSSRTVKKAFYHTYCNRGYYYSPRDRVKAVQFFAKAIKTDPLNRRAYVALGKMLSKLVLLAPKRG